MSPVAPTSTVVSTVLVARSAVRAWSTGAGDHGPMTGAGAAEPELGGAATTSGVGSGDPVAALAAESGSAAVEAAVAGQQVDGGARGEGDVAADGAAVTACRLGD